MLGFYFQPDHDRRVWQFQGSATGLSQITRLLILAGEIAEPSAAVGLGPDGDFGIRVWERPGIDDEGVYGSADDLRRLAALIEEAVRETPSGGELRVHHDYANDVEYALVFRVLPPSFDPASADIDAGGVVPASTADATRTPPLRFSFYDPEDEVQGEGLLQIEAGYVILEYQLWDEEEEKLSPTVEEGAIACDDIGSIEYKRRVIGPLVTFQTRTMKALDGIPSSRVGQLTLRFKRRDREHVERMVAFLNESL